MAHNIIELVDLHKSYSGHEVLKGINLYIRKNEFLTLLGPSGCGKTTTLRLIAGFEQPSAGKILFDGACINGLSPNKRKVNTVFQHYALFSHMNVFENVAFGLRIQKLEESEIRRRVSNSLHQVNLDGYERRGIDSLSGGQQQRVAIARAMVNEPEVLLLDEPLGALDLKMRQGMQLELKALQRRAGITFVYVTHDQEEALTMSDTVVVMRDGEIQQIGTPQSIYNEPKNAFVADFIGESNIIEGVMERDFLVRFGGVSFTCLDKGFGENAPVDVVVRPEDIKLMPPGSGKISCVVDSVVFKGVHYEMVLDSGTFRWLVHSTKSQSIGSHVDFDLEPDDIHVMHKG